MKLNKILKKLQINFKSNIKINKLSINHKFVDKNTCFIALQGNNHHGLDFVNEKFINNVGIIFSDKKTEYQKCICIDNLFYRLSEIVSIMYKNLFKKVKVIGVTGTCGKTTTATMIYEIFKKQNKRVIYFGTHKILYDNKEIDTNNTTLNPIDFINQYLTINQEFDYLVLEVSSHAILENRIDFLNFYIIVFTNFSQDHLDYHLNMDNYFNVKQSLFKRLPKDSYAIINIDDDKAYEIISNTNANIITYGINNGKYTSKDYSRNNIFDFNEYNLLAAYSVSKVLNLNENITIESLNNYDFSYGRSQIVYQKEFRIALDYAHSPGAFTAILSSCKKQCFNRLIVIFGCGGNRDKDKRAKIGKIVDKYADIIILTNDNPRDEDEKSIIADIKKGINKAIVIYDRKKAIEYGISIAKKDDFVLVLGKGNENYQIIKNQKIQFSDLECIKESVKKLE